MELKQFIQNAISDILEAVDEANKTASRKVTFHKHEGKRTVEFDIAVTAENVTSGEAGGGIKVLSIIDVGGKTGTESKNSIVSRINVGIDLENLTHDEEANRKAQFERSRQATTVYNL